MVGACLMFMCARSWILYLVLVRDDGECPRQPYILWISSFPPTRMAGNTHTDISRQIALNIGREIPE
jgi:hypothetical protein